MQCVFVFKMSNHTGSFESPCCIVYRSNNIFACADIFILSVPNCAGYVMTTELVTQGHGLKC